jgi:hypothetical protein
MKLFALLFGLAAVVAANPTRFNKTLAPHFPQLAFEVDYKNDWDQCRFSMECKSNCCSGRWSGGELKCHPVGSTRNDECYYRDYGDAHGLRVKGDWDFCTYSSECFNMCCSRQYSTSDGKLKCTPNGSPEQCHDPHDCMHGGICPPRK